MLEHLQIQPIAPTRTVVVGSGGFVGGAILRELTARGMPAVGLTRKEADLLAPGGGEALARHLKPGDSVVFVSAIAPAKNVTQLMDNLRMAEAACQAFAAIMPGHLVYPLSNWLNW